MVLKQEVRFVNGVEFGEPVLPVAENCGSNAVMSLVQQLCTGAAALFEQTPVLFAYLYGSHVKALSHPFSDLDVGIFVENLDVRACLELELALSVRIDETLGHVVQSEVRALNHLPLAVTGRILGEARLVYSRAENKRIDFETQVRMAYFDFLPVIRRYQEEYRKKLVSR